jgi:pimeloyl-ACP methyl ester carboxylesterase
MSSSVRVSPMRVRLDPEAVDDLRERLARTRSGPGSSAWELGVSPAWVAGLLHDWRAFDVATAQDHLDSWTHLRAEVDGHAIHLVHAPGPDAAAPVLLLTHGWPGSFLEYSRLLPRLTGTFTVAVPSLPGFGFSAAPPASGLTSRQVAGVFHRVMTEGLGHARYVAHGSDLGAGVTAWLARDHPDAVERIHLATPGLASARPIGSAAERAFAEESERWTAEEGGYAHVQSTKPVTLGIALHDSPAGLAGWIGEKVVAWSSTRRDGEPAFDRTLLLTTLTLYWTTGTITSSFLPYWAARHTPGSGLPPDEPPTTPTAVTLFGGERVPFPKPPRDLAERYFRLSAWSQHPVGGHFPAVAEPELLARILRTTLA